MPIAKSQLTPSEQHRQPPVAVLALYLAALRLGIKQGSKEPREFKEVEDSKQ